MDKKTFILTVSQLNRYVKALLEEDKKLSDIYIKGEISNFSRNVRSGHLYLSLKDEGGAIRAVCFKSYAEELPFEPENGMSVLVRASVNVYERDGVYQLYITDMQPEGIGSLAVAFEQRKRRLEQLGLFHERYKKPLPEYPGRIGVVTSETGAALHDIKSVISRRYPICTLVVCPAQVQGENAAESIIKSLKALDQKCDVIILGRGGGSAEDLWAFNDEALAHAIFEAKTPIVSAVGHETDFTISDFVADMRAPTPSAGAALVTPPDGSVLGRISFYREFLLKNAAFLLNKYAEKLTQIKRSPGISSPMDYITKNQQRLDFFAQSLYNKSHINLDRLKQGIATRAALLHSLSPVKILARGYCVAFYDNKAVSDASALKTGEEVALRFCKGEALAKILEIEFEQIQTLH